MVIRFVCALLLIAYASAALAKSRFEFGCRSLVSNYEVATHLYGDAVPPLFSSTPDFTSIDDADPNLLASFEIDGVKDGRGYLQCMKSGALNTMTFSYDFGAGDFSVTRAILVMRAFLTAVAKGDKRWADQEFERLSAKAFSSLKAKQIRGDDLPFGKADVDFEPHYSGRLVVTPEKVTLSISNY